jgi:GTP-binding protein
VGKSSLIRALLNNKKIVRVSGEPGCTTNVNYYSLHKRNHETQAKIYLIDLPGYGFAKAAKTTREQWRKMVMDFLDSRHITILRRVFVLVDGRHGIKDTDEEMIQLLNDSHIASQVKHGQI